VALAENVFQMNVVPGKATAISGLTAALDQPEFATAIGLVKYGSLKKRQRVKRGAFMNTDAIKGMLSKILQRS
jgi:cell division ATPase FtsA